MYGLSDFIIIIFGSFMISLIAATTRGDGENIAIKVIVGTIVGTIILTILRIT